MDDNPMEIEWAHSVSKEVLGAYRDANGTYGTISRAHYHADKRTIMLATGHGSLVLTPEMCDQLGKLLIYIAFTDGELPEPTT